ncbi:MAG: hypothetical protein QXQ48_02215 [Nitrososphaerota archaeon]
MSSDEEGEEAEPGEEEEIVVNVIETPRGRVPEFDSTFRALEKISSRLLEHDEKIEEIASRLAGGQIASSELQKLQETLKAIMDDISKLEKRLEIIEDDLGEIQERLNLLDYLADIVERYLRSQEG